MAAQKEHNSRGQGFRVSIRGVVNNLESKAQFWCVLTAIIPIPSMPIIKKSSVLQRAEEEQVSVWYTRHSQSQGRALSQNNN